MRTFESGATRDVDDTKLDLEGFLHPTVLERFAEYMHENRVQADGNLRASDNWQKGIPKDAYMKSAFRHFMDVWKEHRGIKTKDGMEKAICALMFNIMGYLFELLREKRVVTDQKEYNRRVEDYLTEAVYITKEPYQTKGWDEFIDTRPLENGDYDPIHLQAGTHTSPAPMGGVVGSEVLGIHPVWPEGEVDEMAPEVFVSRCY